MAIPGVPQRVVLLNLILQTTRGKRLGGNVLGAVIFPFFVGSITCSFRRVNSLLVMYGMNFCRDIHNFLTFDPKHTLWVLVITASAISSF